MQNATNFSTFHRKITLTVTLNIIMTIPL